MHDLASVDQDPLSLVLLDLIKLYDNLDCGRLLKTLEGYGAGPKMRGIREILDVSGSGLPEKLLPYPLVQVDLRNHTRGG